MAKKNDWISIEQKPLLSCRVLILFEQFGFSGRHWCTGTYWHLREEWTVDSNEYLGMDISHYKMAEQLSVPNPVYVN